MYTLRLLGSASLEESGGPVAGRAAQGRRLGLLAILALARGRAVSRDRLIGLLWPEATPERARPQLSDAVYVIRSALGEESIRSAGDGLILNQDLITSDTEQFERLLAEGRTEEAVDLFRGPLLDGFYIPDSSEFERWLDGERDQLDRQHANALEVLAETAETTGQVTAAVDWWRRRAVTDPFNGRVALRLMHALEAAGDRAGALQHARIHATLLREELEVVPDPELTDYADRLRREPPRPPRPMPLAASPPMPATGTPAGSGSALPAEPVAEPPAPMGVAGMAPEPAPPALPEPAPVVPATATVRAPRADRIEPGGSRRRPILVVLGAAGVLLALVIGTTRGMWRGAAPEPDARSVGVLPFANMSADPANTYFSDGLSEQIILALSRIDGLRVAARTSSFALRDRGLSVRAIADTLEVQAVLEGSVLVDGERLRVIAQLIDAGTGYHIWSEQYDGDLRDAFAVQDSVAVAIAAALHLRLADPTQPETGEPGIEAYDLYLRGLYLRNSLSAEALRQASDYFDRAISLEPRFAQAWAAKASVIAPQAYFRYADRDSVVPLLRDLTGRALALDSTMGEAYASLGVLRLFYEWDWRGAEEALLRAVELNPSDAHAWHHLGNYYSAMGLQEQATTVRERALQLDPLNPRSAIVLARTYMFTGRFDDALELARRAERLDPVHPLMIGTGPYLPSGAGEILMRMGRLDESVEEFRRIAALRGATVEELDALRAAFASTGMQGFWRSWLVMDLRQSGPTPDPVRIATLHLLSGDTAEALDWLERAFDERNPSLIYIRREPDFAGLRGKPRFDRIVAGMRFPG